MIIMDENYMAHLKTLSRDALLTEYMAANGATIKSYSAVVDSNGTLVQKRPLENRVYIWPPFLFHAPLTAGDT